MRVVRTIAEEEYVSVLTCCADDGNNTRGNLPNAGVAERQNTAGKNVKARHGAKVIDSGAAPRMGMKMPKTSQMVLAVVVTEAMAAAGACGGESV